MTKQPDWELVGTIGDVDPLGYGGGFVFRDKTGVYAPEIEYVEPSETDNGDECVTVYRVQLEPHTYIDGILSDNPYHPGYEVWYGDDLDGVCDSYDGDRDELIADLCGDDAMAKAHAYEVLAGYFGWHEFDSYPLTLTPSEAEERYNQSKYKKGADS